MLVAEAMTPEPVTVGIDCPVKDALGELVRHSITALPVVDGSGMLVGVVSETDLIRTSVPPDPRAHLLPRPSDTATPRTVAEVATYSPVTVRGHDDVATAVALMVAAQVKSLPVVDAAGRAVGVISRSDVARLLARPDRAIASEIAEILRTAGRPEWGVAVSGGVVAIDGPLSDADRSLATSVAHTVPGVMEVRLG